MPKKTKDRKTKQKTNSVILCLLVNLFFWYMPLSKVGHINQQCLFLSIVFGLLSDFLLLNVGMKVLFYQTQAAEVVGRGSGPQKWVVFSYFLLPIPLFSHQVM